MATKDGIRAVLGELRRFISLAQLRAIVEGAQGEESAFFLDKLLELRLTIAAMPQTYEQDGKGDAAVVWLHYFTAGGDWYITERDSGPEQIQAFGLADLGRGGELGYININELLANGAEVDLHWTRCTLAELATKAA